MTHTDQHYEKAIHNLVPINALSDRARAALLPTIERVELPRGHYLFRSGDEDPHYYYVLKGSIDLELDGRSVQRVSATSDVARYALAHATPRTVDARAATPGSGGASAFGQFRAGGGGRHGGGRDWR